MNSLSQSSRRSTLVSAVLLFSTTLLPADECSLAQRLYAPDLATGDEFGGSVALNLPYLLIGASKNGYGRAYFFWKDPNGGAQPWTYVETLAPAITPSSITRFGTSVAFRSLTPVNGHGPRVAVGAPFASSTGSGEGAVYLFRGASGPEHSILTEPVPAAGNGFGFAVSMSHRILAVGAPFRDRNDNEDVGAIFLYHAVNDDLWLPQLFDWQYLTTRINPQADPPPNLGFSLANTNDFLVAGAPALGQSDPGGALILGRDTGGPDYWGVVRILDPPDPDPSARFGWSVAIDGDVVAVGARNVRSREGVPQGAVYLFGRNQGGADQWGQIGSVMASDSADYASFGHSVALSDGILAVGAPGHPAETGVLNKGAVYLYEPHPIKGWREIGRITDRAASPVDELYGFAVVLEGSDLAVGAPLAKFWNAEPGAVTMHEIPAVENVPGNLLINGSFSEPPPEPLTGGLPTGTGYWKGDSTAALAVATGGITPVLQSLMIQFVATGTSGNPTLSGTCALYQLVDLTPYADRIATGRVVASLSFAANRVAGDARTDDEFIAQIRAYNGNPADFPTNHNGSVMTSIHTDANPATWETLTTELTVPAGTTYLAVRISALENEQNDLLNPEFDGHYADKASLLVHLEPTMPEILDVQIVPGNEIRIRYTTEQGYRYSLQKSADLRTWTTVCWGIPGTGLEQEVLIPGGMMPKTYYRIVAGW